MTKGWKFESSRHSLARRGLKTGRKSTKRANPIKPDYTKKTNEIFKKLKDEFTVSRNEEEFWGNYETDFKRKITEALKEGKTDEEAKEAGYEEAEVYRSEGNPVATITIYEPDGTEDKIVISEYDIFDESREGYGEDFIPKWHKTDAWRGYYEIEARGWTPIHEDTALSYSEDAEELKKFNDELIEELKSRGIPVAQAVSTTSNVFSASVDYYVPDEHSADVEELVEKLKKKHRDPERFASTALTGADPKEQTKEDKKFVKAVKKMQKKEMKAIDVMKDILKETKRDEFGLAMADVMRINKEKGQYFFTPDTMRFFKSKVESKLYKDKYFITSEQAPDMPRKYSVRKFDKKTGDISTVGEFQAYGSKESAKEALKKLKVK